MTKQGADDRPARFVAELDRLERGPLAQLRRSLGGDERGVYWLEGLYTRTGYGAAKEYEKDALQLVAGLYALKPRARQDEGDAAEEETPPAETVNPEPAPSIGTLMGQLYLKQDRRPSTEKRFLALLDADRDGLPYHLRQAVTLLATENLTPDWARLTRDLLRWGDRVRRAWAQDFYREISREPTAQADAPPAASSDEARPAPTPAPQTGDDADGDRL
ncbi:CRISPR-associated protein Cse2 [Deinococcus sp. RL]|uniref:type I-E CRISPR-associated protein Cse2/CasB n=1 Tax=Deinococcus sp. RL TaxID=1489678 RepID=UPI0004D69FC9|nr:type I-E CRISPR-associated protein Cse2/CasB [Deinococcus sp. RL]KEF35523.1 CRISPR-associated protein Cse2 [Deinococcus sp. RL]